MYQILLGSVILSLIHALIPNHWLPLIAISKAEKWGAKKSLLVTLLAGFSHSLSTVLIGIIVGFAGVALSNSYEYITRIAAPVLLFSIGLIYFLVDLKHSHHHHDHIRLPDQNSGNTSKIAIIVSLCLAMFLTPCIEIEAYYFQASRSGWPGIIVVSAVYMFSTLLVMLLLVHLGLKGINKFKSHYLEHHEKRITGIVMMFLGLLAFIGNF